MCWRRSGSQSAKKLDFKVKRNFQHSEDPMDSNSLDEIFQELELLEDELEDISRNIQKQKDVEDEHFAMAGSAASTQTWMSIIKMLIVIGICMGQVYLITKHFQKT